jgi:thiamine kinase
MVTALPGNIRLKLEQTLAQWRQWHVETPLAHAPTVVSRLSAGLSNFSLLVEAGSQFVVRIDGIKPSAHGLNRQGEWRSLSAAHRAGLAPRPCYFNPELGSLVCDYLTPDEQQPVDVKDIAKLLRDIHQLPARHHRLDLPERILSYEKRLAHRHPERTAKLADHSLEVSKILDATGTDQQPLVLCHNDLLRANRLYSAGKLYAVDWEYSAMGSALYDLAVVAAGDNLAPAATKNLLEAYTERPPTPAEIQLVTQYSCVYRYLELLWYLTQDNSILGDPEIGEKIRLLGENLIEADIRKERVSGRWQGVDPSID